MSELEILVVADEAAASTAAGDRIGVALRSAVNARGSAHWATTGG